MPLGLPGKAMHDIQASHISLQTLLRDPTSVPLEGWRRAKTKFMELDPLDTGLVSVTDAMFIAEWMWDVYHPCGIAIDGEEKREGQQELYSAIRARMDIGIDSDGYYFDPCIDSALLYSWFKAVDAKMRLRRMKNTSTAQLVRMDRDLEVPAFALVKGRSPRAEAASAHGGAADKRKRGSTLDWLLGRGNTAEDSTGTGTGAGTGTGTGSHKAKDLPSETALKPLRSAHLPIPARRPSPLSPLALRLRRRRRRRDSAHPMRPLLRHTHTAPGSIATAKLFNPNAPPSVVVNGNEVDCAGGSKPPHPPHGQGLARGARHHSQVRLSDLHHHDDDDNDDGGTSDGEEEGDEGTRSAAVDDASTPRGAPSPLQHTQPRALGSLHHQLHR